MRTISTTNARKNFKAIVDEVTVNGEVFGLSRQNQIDALIIKFPRNFNSKLNELTNLNAYSKSFDFLEKEPDLYSLNDII